MRVTMHWRGKNKDYVNKDERIWYEKVTNERVHSFASKKFGKGCAVAFPWH